jgi:probable HAF family extracellular repeat protein
MRTARTVNSWNKSWGLTLLLLEIFYVVPAQAQQSELRDQEAQGAAAQSHPHNHNHHHYQLIDLGAFGGPASYFSNGFDGILNNQGVAVGWADTYKPDPYPPFCFSQDCFVSHAFQTRNGVVTDLGVLPGGLSSQALWITANGLIAGNSQNGQIDPLFPGFPENRAVLWRNGTIVDLGTLPEGGYESFASTVNSRGQVVGFALNTIPDSFSLAGPGFFPTQTRAFLWQDGTMQDLGTLGGSGAFAFFVNERGQIAGQSYTNSTPNPVTGLPTADPFLWENGTMQDLGSLGGTFGVPRAINNRGQVIGISNLAGDMHFHPFLWTKSGSMQDLGTLGGDTGDTNWINDEGDIAGKADVPGPKPQDHNAVLWRNSLITDLGRLPGDSCANAYYVNAHDQVVGTSENRDLCTIPTGEHAFLWENGGPMVDLNTLIPSGSSLQLTFAVAVNDRGEIAGFGVPAGCAPQDVNLCGHAYVLIPCDENPPGADDCDNSMVDASAATHESAGSIMQKATTTAPRVPAFYSPSNDIRRTFQGRFGFNRLAGGPQQVALSGAVAATSAPIATLSPTSLAFWPEAIGTTSGAWPVTLKNIGTTSLTISRIAITGPNAGDFAQSHTCGNSLAAGASCTVSVTFKATQIGKRTGTLSVTDNAHGSPQTVSLSGSGTDVVLSPTSLGFVCIPHVIICSCVTSRTATLTNVGSTTLKISGIAALTGPFSQTNSCGASVAAGGSCSIKVRWSPLKGGGIDQGLVSISDNGGASPQTLPLRGYKRCSPHVQQEFP